MAFRFAHMLPLEHIYQYYIHFVRVLLNASANGKMVVAHMFRDVPLRMLSAETQSTGSGFKILSTGSGFRVQSTGSGFMV